MCRCCFVDTKLGKILHFTTLCVSDFYQITYLVWLQFRQVMLHRSFTSRLWRSNKIWTFFPKTCTIMNVALVPGKVICRYNGKYNIFYNKIYNRIYYYVIKVKSFLPSFFLFIVAAIHCFIIRWFSCYYYLPRDFSCYYISRYS